MTHPGEDAAVATQAGAGDELTAAALVACRGAHAPYSRFRVGAALRSAAGHVYTGCNVENAAFPLGQCAEAGAIAAGVRAEGAAFRIVEVAVYAEDQLGRRRAASPCGGCRQRIHEFAAGEQVTVRFAWPTADARTATIGELLPFAFTLPVR